MNKVNIENLTVYVTESRDGVIRMALHPMDSSPPLGSGSNKQRVNWPFRVAYSRGHWESWRKSCRGNSGYDGFIGGEKSALNWLLKGEK